METTLNIHPDILKRITQAAQSNNISRSGMIIVLLKKTMDTIIHPDCIGRMVQYQKKNILNNWHTFHIQLNEDDYEYFLDLRKFLKMSVSLLLAFAVERFLSQITKKSITDNNRFSNYVIIKETIDNLICWKLIWGYPRNIEKFITIQNT